MFRMRATVTKISSSSHSEILDYCFVISFGNVPYEPLKHIYGFSYKLGCSGKHCLPWNPTKEVQKWHYLNGSLENESLGDLCATEQTDSSLNP